MNTSNKTFQSLLQLPPCIELLIAFDVKVWVYVPPQTKRKLPPSRLPLHCRSTQVVEGCTVHTTQHFLSQTRNSGITSNQLWLRGYFQCEINTDTISKEIENITSLASDYLNQKLSILYSTFFLIVLQVITKN